MFIGASVIPSISGNTKKITRFDIDDGENVEFASGEFIVKFKAETIVDVSKSPDGWICTGLDSIDVLNEKHYVTIIERLFNSYEKTHLYNIFKFSVPLDSDILAVVQEYSLDNYVVYAEPNYIYHVCATPNDPDFNVQWALHNTGQTNGTIDADIDAPEAWDIETGDENIVIAIHDTGVDWDHPDLEVNIWVNPGEDLNGNGIVDPSDFNDVDDDGNGFVDDIRGWDFVNTTKPVYPGEDGTERDNDPMDFHGHGTHCSGIASAATDNNIGMAGVCWNCSIMAVRVGYKCVSGGGTLELDDAAAGIEYAANNGADIISMSWGGYSISELIWDAINYSYSLGVVLVAAAGNAGFNGRLYPAAYDDVIAVGATDHNDSRADFSWWGSNYGSWVDVSAPGVDVYSTLFNDTYESWGGTSMATPHVAGLAALILSKNPGFNQMEIRTIIRSTTDDVNSEEYIGTGRINAYTAIQRDFTPIVNLDSSLDDVIVSTEAYINGTASGGTFVNYSVCYGVGVYPDEWTPIHSSSTPVTDGVLALWDPPSPVDEVIYTVQLLVYDTAGQVSEDWVVVVVNRAPDKTSIDGPASGKAGSLYTYYFNSTDPDGDDLYYYIDWGDDQFEEWIGPYASGEEVRASHTWSEQGTYTIKAKARDIFDKESDWAYLEITMPVNQQFSNSLFLRLLERFPNAFMILRHVLEL